MKHNILHRLKFCLTISIHIFKTSNIPLYSYLNVLSGYLPWFLWWASLDFEIEKFPLALFCYNGRLAKLVFKRAKSSLKKTASLFSSQWIDFILTFILCLRISICQLHPFKGSLPIHNTQSNWTNLLFEESWEINPFFLWRKTQGLL